eukprot:gene10871-14589_t
MNENFDLPDVDFSNLSIADNTAKSDNSDILPHNNDTNNGNGWSGGTEWGNGWNAVNCFESWVPSIPESYQIRKFNDNPNITHIEDEMFESNVRVFFSCDEAWELFFQSSPKAVGIDCEGLNDVDVEENNGYPLMIQISTSEIVIIEFPGENSTDEYDQACLSSNLTKLLLDKNILKVFFDPTGFDVKLLNIDVQPRVDIADLIKQKYDKLDSKGKDLVGMGLIDTLSTVAKKVYKKQSIRSNGWWGLRSPKAIRTSKAFINYAAADAWGTLLAYNLLNEM